MGSLPLSQISNISVTVNVNHQRDQEVEMYLIAPGGSTTTIIPTPLTLPTLTKTGQQEQ